MIKIIPGICYIERKINISTEMVGGMQTVQNIALFVLRGFLKSLPPPVLPLPRDRSLY